MLKNSPFRRIPFLVLLLLLALQSCRKPETTFPLIRDLTVSVYAPGRLVDQQAYLLFAPANGLLHDWKVAEGDTLRAGQLLALVESSNSDLNRENARLRMEEIRDNLAEGSTFRKDLQLAVENAYLRYRDDSINYARQQRLWEQGVGTKRELEARELAMESSARQYRSAEKQKELRVQQLQTEYRTSRNLLHIARNQSLDFRVESRIDGILAEIKVNEGEIVAPQQALGRISGLEELQLELEVDEVDIVKVEVGQRAVISLDAYPDQVFPGRVKFVHTRKDRNAQSYRIEVAFDQPPAKVYEGMTAEANIVVEERKQALLIPQSFLMSENRVLTASGDTLKLEIGASDLEFSEVLDGLDAQTALQKPGS